MILANIKEIVKKLPENPGVYTFEDKIGQVLYIGKATNLKERVRQYFSGSDVRGERIFSMVEKIEKIKTQKTDSVLEALILESNLIKKYQPKYNIKEKDDKSFSYFAITRDEFPRIIILRQTNLDKNKKLVKYFFGPYTSKKQMEIAIGIIRKIFPFHSLAQKTEKGCLDFQLGGCPGPYSGMISKKDYAKNIKAIEMILSGKKKNLVKSLEKKMIGYSSKNEFEKAAEIRNKIFALRHIQDVALIANKDFSKNIRKKFRVEAYDISNISGQLATGSMVVFENGEMNKNEYRKFRIKTISSSNDVGMMAEVLFRRFKNSWPKPDLILLDGGQGHLNMAEKVLRELDLKVPVLAVAKGPSRKNLDLRPKVILPQYFDEKNIKKIMDEAHRFAISFHKKIRKKSFLG